MTERIHDFTAKLRQGALAGSVSRYVAWHRDAIAARAAGLPLPEAQPSAPISINLDLTTACNFRCDHCIDWEILNSTQRHADATLRASIETLAARGLRSVILIGGGEPTLYPGFASFVAFLKDIGLDVAVVSNGSRGDRLLEISDQLGEADWVRLSLDAGSNATFRAMHRPARSDLDLDAICAWIPRIKARNPRLKLGFSFLIVWNGATRGDVELIENVDEIESAARRARDAGFDYIAYKPVLERSDDGSEVMLPTRRKSQREALLARIRAGIDRAREFRSDDFDVHVSTNLRVLERGNWRDFTRQPRTCHMQAFRQVLTPAGLWNCPAHRGVAKARIAGRDAYASATEAAATDAGLARMIFEFDASTECREVTCLYNAANWWLDGIVNGDAPEQPSTGDGRDFFL